MSSPPDLRYIKDHDWARIEPDGSATLGITEFAQDSLGDVVFVELPEAGAEVTQFKPFGEIESVKAVSELVSAISGTVTERNEALLEKPELVNESPYGDGWLLKIQVGDASELDNLMSAEEYDAFLASEAE